LAGSVCPTFREGLPIRLAPLHTGLFHARSILVRESAVVALAVEAVHGEDVGGVGDAARLHYLDADTPAVFGPDQ
jgi:hypothetical protein